MNDIILDDDLFTVIVDSMNDVEKSTPSGFMKKKLVLQTVYTVIGRDAYERYLPILELVIDGLVLLGKKDLKLLIKSSRNCYRRCC